MVSESERKHSIEILERIEEKRRAAGIQKTAMFKASGTSSSALSQWRTGLTKPSMRSIAALAECLGTTQEYLLFGTKEKPTDDGGLSPQQRELIDILRRLSPPDVAVLLAAARELAAARQYQDGRE